MPRIFYRFKLLSDFNKEARKEAKNRHWNWERKRKREGRKRWQRLRVSDIVIDCWIDDEPSLTISNLANAVEYQRDLRASLKSLPMRYQAHRCIVTTNSYQEVSKQKRITETTIDGWGSRRSNNSQLSSVKTFWTKEQPTSISSNDDGVGSHQSQLEETLDAAFSC